MTIEIRILEDTQNTIPHSYEDPDTVVSNQSTYPTRGDYKTGFVFSLFLSSDNLAATATLGKICMSHTTLDHLLL